MARTRLKHIVFEGSSNKLRARAMKRIGLSHKAKPTFFSLMFISTNYTV